MTSAHIEPAVPGTTTRGPSGAAGPAAGRGAARSRCSRPPAGSSRSGAPTPPASPTWRPKAASRSAPCSTTSARARTCWWRRSGTRRARRSPSWRPRSRGIDDPWEQLERILTRSLTGYEPETPDAGRLWIESWHFGIRDPEMRADALRDNTAWRRLVAGVVRRGIELGTFSDRYDAGHRRRAGRRRRRRDGHPAVARRPGRSPPPARCRRAGRAARVPAPITDLRQPGGSRSRLERASLSAGRLTRF